MGVLTYNKDYRDLRLYGTITRMDGVIMNVSTTPISSTYKYTQLFHYNFSNSLGGTGVPLGGTESGSYSLTIENADKRYKPSMFDGAEVRMYIGIRDAGRWVDSPFGVFYVDAVSAPEQGTQLTLSGYDALSIKFNDSYTDTTSQSMSLKQLLNTVMLGTGIQIAGQNFRNADVIVTPVFEDGQEVTIRDILSYIATVACGFARMGRDGRLEIASFVEAERYDIGPNMYRTFSQDGGSDFEFNCLEARVASDAEDYTRYAIDSAVKDNATNTIQVDYFPFMSAAIAQLIAQTMRGYTAQPGSIAWGGDPAVRIGDFFNVTTLSGEQYKLLVSDEEFTFDGGLSYRMSSSLPSINSTSSGSYSTATSVFNANGNINVQRIDGFDKKAISATDGYIGNLTSDNIRTDTLAANLINVLKLYAESIKANEVSTDNLTAAFAAIMEATINKLNAGTITANELTAEFARLTAATIGKAEIDWAKIGTLQTDVAQMAKAEIDKAEINYARIKDADVDQLIVKDGIADRYFIDKLAIRNAQIIEATVGELVIKASDGNYYRLDIGIDGKLSPTKVTLTSGEIASGQTKDGHASIIETDLTVADLSASNLKAINALIDKITADRINVDVLFARQAFIDLLKTSKIVGDKTLTVMTQDTADALAAAKQAQTDAKKAQTTAITGFDSLAVLVGDTMDDVAEAQKTADNAQSTASTAKTQATNAASTAGVAVELAADANTAAADAQSTANSASSIAQNAQASIIDVERDQASFESTFFQYFELDTHNGIVMKALTDEGEPSHWNAQMRSDGFYIFNDQYAAPTGRFYRDRFEPSSMQMGEIKCRPSAKGGWVFTHDGGDD